jgi:NADPH-dependent glutamate synthase beta subunit-like oxidoreductase
MPRDLSIPGRELECIHYAVDFLTQQNREIAGEKTSPTARLSASGKNVLVIGGGDTGSDCVGTSRRQEARTIYQIEILPKPPETRLVTNPWPEWPVVMRTSTSHEEGCTRLWSVTARAFLSENGKVKSVRLVEVEWVRKNGRQEFKEIDGSDFTINAELVLLSTGFLHVEHGPLIKEFNLAIDNRGNLVTDSAMMTSVPSVFAAGDNVLGASLVVRAIAQGRKAAEGVHAYLSK